MRAWGGGPDGQSHDLKAQPGLDLVQEGINELRRVNAAQALLIGASGLLLLTASAITTGSVGWNLAILLVIVTEVAQGWHAQVTADKMLQLGDPYPLLISFVPTHHATQFDGTLSDLVLAHLDPDWSSIGAPGATPWSGGLRPRGRGWCASAPSWSWPPS